MPQIGPINWILLILIFLLILITINTSFQQITPPQINSCNNTTTNNSLNW